MSSAVLVCSLAIWRRDLLRIKWRDLPYFAASGLITVGLVFSLYAYAISSIGGSVAASLGAISGVALSAHARSERDSLVRERTALEKLRPAPGPGSPPQLLEMPSFEAAFAFAF